MLTQIIVNVIVASAIYSLVGLGFALIFSIARFFHFAHGVIFTAGAYLTFFFNGWFCLPLFLAIPLAITLTTLLGGLMELSVYRPLRRKGASSLVFLLASLGIYIVFQNTISLIFGDDTKTIRSGVVEEGINILGARITPIQMFIVCVSTVLVILLAVLLKRTKIGKAMRAVANDPELAIVSGIESNWILLVTFAIGSTLAGSAGILMALDIDMTPTMGMNALMIGVVSVIIGGVGSIIGIALGALLLATAQNLGAWKISSQWQNAIAFAILLAFLLFRPQGFLGRKVRKAIV